MKKTLAILLALVLFASCSKSEEPTPTPSELTPIGFSFDATEFDTKASSAMVDSLGSLRKKTFLMLRGADGTVQLFDSPTTVDVTMSDDFAKVLTANPLQYINVARTQANFAAFYPKVTPSSNVLTYTASSTTSLPDIIVANVATATYAAPTAALSFKHVTACVEFYIKAEDATTGAAYGKLTSATVSLSPTNKITLAANGTWGALVASGTKFDVDFGATSYYLSTSAVKVGEICMAVSDRPTAIKLAYTYRATAQSHTIALPNPLVAGTKYKLTATVKRTGVAFTCTVADWAAGTDTAEDVY